MNQYAAVYLASGEWAEQADSLPPAAAVAAGRTAAFAIFAEVFGKSDA